MRNADLPERHPRQQHGDEEEQRGDELGRARARGGRLMRMVSVAVVMDDSVVAVGRWGTAGLWGVIARVVLRAVSRPPPRMPRACAAQRNDRRNDAAEQREKDDRLIHKRD